MSKTETVRHSLYGGQVEIDFYPKSHRYKLIETKEWLPSPSSVNNKLDKSGALIPWAVGCFKDKMHELMGDGVNFTYDDVTSMLKVAETAHTEKKEAAASVGSVVHLYAEHGALPDEYDELSDEDKDRADKAMTSFDDWKKENVPEMIKSEFLVYSQKHKYVGTADGLAEIDGKKYLIDYKTSKGIYTSHLYQVSAYLKAFEEEHGVKLDGAMIVHFRKDDVYDKDGEMVYGAGSFGVKTLSRGDLVTAFKGFKALLDIYHTDKVVYKMTK